MSSGFFHNSVSKRPVSISLGKFRIFTKIRGDTRNFVFIAGVVDTGDKLFTGVIDIGDTGIVVTDKLSPVIKLLKCFG